MSNCWFETLIISGNRELLYLFYNYIALCLKQEIAKMLQWRTPQVKRTIVKLLYIMHLYNTICSDQSRKPQGEKWCLTLLQSTAKTR